MKIEKITSSKDSRLGVLLAVYEDSFPIDERRPTDNLLDLIDHSDLYEFFAAESDDRVVGLITVWQFAGFAYVEHFAISSALRGKSFGSQIMSRLQEMTDKSIILEIEPVDADGIPDFERDKRIARLRFYNRLGFVECNKEYVQPPYSPDLSPVPLILLESPGSTVLLPEKFDMVRDTIHKKVYGVLP